MNKFALKDFTSAIELLLRDKELVSVTIFCSPLSKITQRVRATRKLNDQILVTFGKPNFQEREFIKSCKKAKTTPRRSWLHFKSKKKSLV